LLLPWHGILQQQRTVKHSQAQLLSATAQQQLASCIFVGRVAERARHGSWVCDAMLQAGCLAPGCGLLLSGGSSQQGSQLDAGVTPAGVPQRTQQPKFNFGFQGYIQQQQQQ
jgi:hypothetical protein